MAGEQIHKKTERQESKTARRTRIAQTNYLSNLNRSSFIFNGQLTPLGCLLLLYSCGIIEASANTLPSRFISSSDDSSAVLTNSTKTCPTQPPGRPLSLAEKTPIISTPSGNNACSISYPRPQQKQNVAPPKACPLNAACMELDISQVEKLLNNRNLEYFSDGMDILHSLIKGLIPNKNQNKTETALQILKILISKGLDVDLDGPHKEKLKKLMSAAKKVGWRKFGEFLQTHHDCKKIFIQMRVQIPSNIPWKEVSQTLFKGISEDPTLIDFDENMLFLYHLIGNNDYNGVQRALKYGYNPNKKTVYDLPLIAAFSIGNSRIITLLVNQGARIPQNDHTLPHLYNAILAKDPKKLALFEKLEWNINQAKAESPIPFEWACQTGDLPTVDVLIHMGADIHGAHSPEEVCCLLAVIEGYARDKNPERIFTLHKLYASTFKDIQQEAESASQKLIAAAENAGWHECRNYLNHIEKILDLENKIIAFNKLSESSLSDSDSHETTSSALTQLGRELFASEVIDNIGLITIFKRTGIKLSENKSAHYLLQDALASNDTRTLDILKQMDWNIKPIKQPEVSNPAKVIPHSFLWSIHYIVLGFMALLSAWMYSSFILKKKEEIKAKTEIFDQPIITHPQKKTVRRPLPNLSQPCPPPEDPQASLKKEIQEMIVRLEKNRDNITHKMDAYNDYLENSIAYFKAKSIFIITDDQIGGEIDARDITVLSCFTCSDKDELSAPIQKKKKEIQASFSIPDTNLDALKQSVELLEKKYRLAEPVFLSKLAEKQQYISRKKAELLASEKEKEKIHKLNAKKGITAVSYSRQNSYGKNLVSLSTPANLMSPNIVPPTSISEQKFSHLSASPKVFASGKLFSFWLYRETASHIAKKHHPKATRQEAEQTAITASKKILTLLALKPQFFSMGENVVKIYKLGLVFNAMKMSNALLERYQWISEKKVYCKKDLEILRNCMIKCAPKSSVEINDFIAFCSDVFKIQFKRINDYYNQHKVIEPCHLEQFCPKFSHHVFLHELRMMWNDYTAVKEKAQRDPDYIPYDECCDLLTYFKELEEILSIVEKLPDPSVRLHAAASMLINIDLVYSDFFYQRPILDILNDTDRSTVKSYFTRLHHWRNNIGHNAKSIDIAEKEINKFFKKNILGILEKLKELALQKMTQTTDSASITMTVTAEMVANLLKV